MRQSIFNFTCLSLVLAAGCKQVRNSDELSTPVLSSDASLMQLPPVKVANELILPNLAIGKCWNLPKAPINPDQEVAYNNDPRVVAVRNLTPQQIESNEMYQETIGDKIVTNPRFVLQNTSIYLATYDKDNWLKNELKKYNKSDKIELIRCESYLRGMGYSYLLKINDKPTLTFQTASWNCSESIENGLCQK
jgi:hypothetical protein